MKNYLSNLYKQSAGICLFIFFSFVVYSNSSFAKTDPVLEFAIQQINQKYYTAALSTLNNYLETHPKDADALYWKGHIYFHTDKYLAAAESYSAVLKLNSKYLPAYEDMATMQMKQKNYALALPFFNEAMALKDSDVNLLNSRGMCYYYLDKFELAIKDFKMVIKLDPQNYLAYNNRGSAEYNNQNIASANITDLRLALKDFNAAINLKPDFELAYRNRGIVRYYLDSLPAAYKDLLYAVQLDPEDENAHYYLGKLFFKQNTYPVAIQFYDNAIKLVNYKAEIYLDRGLCQLEMGNYKLARSDFYQSLRLTDDHGLSEYHTARSFAAENNKNDAIYALREAKKQGLFIDIKYFTYMARDKYFIKYAKDKPFQEFVKELKFGKKN